MPDERNRPMNQASKNLMLNAIHMENYLDEAEMETREGIWRIALLDVLLAIAYTVCGDPESEEDLNE